MRNAGRAGPGGGGVACHLLARRAGQPSHGPGGSGPRRALRAVDPLHLRDLAGFAGGARGGPVRDRRGDSDGEPGLASGRGRQLSRRAGVGPTRSGASTPAFQLPPGHGGVRGGGPDARAGAMERRRAALPRCAARAPPRGLSAPQGSPHRPLDPPLRAADCDAGRCQLLPVRHARGHAEIGGPKAPAPHGAGEAPTGPSASPAPRSLRERPSHPPRGVPPSHRAKGPRWAPGIATHREWVA